MKICFEDESTTKTFLEFCRIVAYVLEENEKLKNQEL